MQGQCTSYKTVVHLFVFVVEDLTYRQFKDGGFMVFNATFNNISVILWRFVISNIIPKSMSHLQVCKKKSLKMVINSTKYQQ
jgi:hypothetical protein